MKIRLDELCLQAESAVQQNRNVLILSDRATSSGRVPIPMLLAIGTVHHHLNRIRKRMRASLVIESGEIRDVHQIACCVGFGATAICPYLGYATVRQLVAADAGKGKLGEITAQKAMTNYRKALEKGILKIMSKMGISVLNSYQGAQTFEAIRANRFYVFTHPQIMPAVRARLDAAGAGEGHISLSDEAGMVVAVAVILRRG